MIFHDTLDISASAKSSNLVKPGRYEGIFLSLAGTYSGSIAEPNQVITVMLNGATLIRATWQQLRKLADLWMGKPTLTAGTAFAFAFKVPFYHPMLKTAINITRSDKMTIESEAIGVTVTTAVLNISMLPSDEPEAYRICINGTSATLTGSLYEFLMGSARNVSTVILFDASTTNPTNVLCVVDGVQKFYGTYTALKQYSNCDARIEASALDLAVLNFVRNGRIDESLSESVLLTVDSGAGTMGYLIISHSFDPDRTEASIAAVQAFIDAKVERATSVVPSALVAAGVSADA